MSDFLINLACRGAGLPPNPPAISVAPATMSPGNAVAPDAMGADVAAYSEPVASDDDQSTQLPSTSQSIASPSAPSRWDGGSTVSNVESLITPESRINRSLGSIPSPPVSNPPSVVELVPSESRKIKNGQQDSREKLNENVARPKVMRFFRAEPSDSKLQQPPPPSPAPEAASIKDGISAPVAVLPSVPESRERFALSRAGEMSRPGEVMPVPIHVRIGRIEVRGTSAPAPQGPRKVTPPAPLGFASYLRPRTYRNWPR
jgi:hypothetical protein